mgnify:CR=1 FL=1
MIIWFTIAGRVSPVSVILFCKWVILSGVIFSRIRGREFAIAGSFCCVRCEGDKTWEQNKSFPASRVLELRQ